MERNEIVKAIINALFGYEPNIGESVIKGSSDQGDGLITIICRDGSKWNINVTER